MTDATLIRAPALDLPRAAGAVFIALVALAAAPVFLWPIPRANDIVNHWARLTLYGMSADDPLRALYHAHFGLVPNLGVDALYVALSPLLSAQSVARLALALSIALPAAGAWALHRALFERPSPTIWLVPFLSYNVATTVGLVNFAMGMGLALLGLAYAVRRPALRGRDILALNALGAALFFCHLIALAAFALLLGLLLVAPLTRPPRAIGRSVGLALLALALPLALVAMREATPSTYALSDTTTISLFHAPVAAMTGSDQLAQWLLIGVCVAAVACGARLAPRATLAAVGFALGALAAPSAMGAASLIDSRLKVYVWYFVVAATWMPASASVRPLFALLAAALTAARLSWVAPAWIEFQDRAAEVRRGLEALPLGSRALVVAPRDCHDHAVSEMINLAPFAVIDRRSYVNTLFAQSGVQPVAPTDSALDGGPTIAMDPRWLDEKGQETLPAHLRDAPWAAPYRDWRAHFTHVIYAHGACGPGLATDGLMRIGGAAGLEVYRVD